MMSLVHIVTTMVDCIAGRERECRCNIAAIERIARSEYIVAAAVGVSQSACDAGALRSEAALVCKHSSLSDVLA